jgi:hypothetical protein
MPRQTQRSIRGRQPYVEAFPALDALALAREQDRGHGCCQWTNERGLVVGHIEITAITDEEVALRSHFLGAPNVGKKIGKHRFAIHHYRANENYLRPSLVCPDCGRTARFLYMVAGHWSCRTCHDLTSISQLLGNVTRYLRRLQELAVVVERGRPRWGRKEVFANLVDEYWRLRKDFADAPPLPPELAFAQYAEWLAPGDPALKQRVQRGEQGFGWTRFDEGGFLRLTWLAEQELKVYDDAQRAPRGRAAASAVKQLWSTGPGARQAPFASGPVSEPTPPGKPKPKRFRFDPAALDGTVREDG